ncbi:hypothetical protein D3C75_484210 [compost metagenome]
MKFKMTPQEASLELSKRMAAGDTREVAHFIVWYVEDLKDAKKFETLNEFIGIINPEVDTYVSSAILRSSYTHGMALTNWKPFLDGVREAHKDNPRIDRILVGLDRPYTPSVYH